MIVTTIAFSLPTVVCRTVVMPVPAANLGNHDFYLKVLSTENKKYKTVTLSAVSRENIDTPTKLKEVISTQSDGLNPDTWNFATLFIEKNCKCKHCPLLGLIVDFFRQKGGLWGVCSCICNVQTHLYRLGQLLQTHLQSHGWSVLE